MEPILLIMAAGIGRRYGGNKQFDRITDEGDIIMDFSLFDAYMAGFRRACFIIARDFEEEFKTHIESGAGRKFEVSYAFQDMNDIPEGFAIPEGRSKPWGTGHAALAARDIIDAPFAVINADDYYGREGFVKTFKFLTEKADASHNCMVGFELEKTLSENGAVSRGICKEKDGILTDIKEHLCVAREADGTVTDTFPDGRKEIIPHDSPVSMNLWGFGAEYMDVLKEGFKKGIGEIIRDNPLKGEYYIQSPIPDQISGGFATFEMLKSTDRWFGVTYKEDRPLVAARLKELKDTGFYPRRLWD